MTTFGNTADIFPSRTLFKTAMKARVMSSFMWQQIRFMDFVGPVETTFKANEEDMFEEQANNPWGVTNTLGNNFFYVWGQVWNSDNNVSSRSGTRVDQLGQVEERCLDEFLYDLQCNQSLFCTRSPSRWNRPRQQSFEPRPSKLSTPWCRYVSRGRSRPPFPLCCWLTSPSWGWAMESMALAWQSSHEPLQSKCWPQRKFFFPDGPAVPV